MSVRDLTLLLALKDRTPYTFRWMAYHNAIRLPFRVFVADGGADQRVTDALSGRAGFPNLDFEYVRYPYDATSAQYYAKLADALERIQTPFVALADNDDLFVVTGLQRSIEFLAGHPDYSACGGQCAVFWIHPDEADPDADVLYGPRIEWKCSLERTSLTDDTANARLLKLPRRTAHAVFYHVRRTEDLRRELRLIRDAAPQDLFLFERWYFFLMAIAGKTKQLDTLHIARQWNSPGSAGGANEARIGDWFGRMLVPSWSRDFRAFVDAAAAALAAKDNLPADEARRRVVNAYRTWVTPHLLADVAAEPTVTLGMALGMGLFRRLLRLSTGNALRRAARTIYRRAPWVSVEAIYGTEWRTRRVSGAVEAFRPVQEFLANSSTDG